MKLNVEKLLEPIAGKDFCGEDLRYEPVYDQIRELRREDDPTLPQGVWERDLKKADWEGCADLCASALETRSKDLQLALWLAEAVIHLDGYNGVNQGLRLIVTLCRQYWPDLYPRPEEGEKDEHRWSLFHWMNEKMPAKVKEVPVTKPAKNGQRAYSMLDWELAVRHDDFENGSNGSNGADGPKANGAANGSPPGGVTLAKFNASVEATSREFFLYLSRRINTSLTLLDELDGLMLEYYGDEQPSMQHLRDALNQAQIKALKVLEERPIQKAAARAIAEEEKRAEAEREAQEAGEAETGPGFDRPLQTREDAYQLMARVADFLMRVEPHSPTPYLLKRVSSWGEKSLFDLLRELAPRDDERSRLSEVFLLK